MCAQVFVTRALTDLAFHESSINIHETLFGLFAKETQPHILLSVDHLTSAHTHTHSHRHTADIRRKCAFQMVSNS